MPPEAEENTLDSSFFPNSSLHQCLIYSWWSREPGSHSSQESERAQAGNGSRANRQLASTTFNKISFNVSVDKEESISHITHQKTLLNVISPFLYISLLQQLPYRSPSFLPTSAHPSSSLPLPHNSLLNLLRISFVHKLGSSVYPLLAFSIKDGSPWGLPHWLRALRLGKYCIVYIVHNSINVTNLVTAVWLSLKQLSYPLRREYSPVRQLTT